MKKKNIIMLVLNLIVVISTFIVVVKGIATGASEGQVGENISGLGYFKPFTIDSNILNAVFAFIVMVFNINNLIEKKDEMPYWVTLAQYIGTTAVTVTFLTVVFFLAPMQVTFGNSYFLFFENDMFFMHFLNPVLSIIIFTLLIDKHEFKLKERLLSLLPTILYSFVYVYMVVIKKGWSDFYNFTFGGKSFMIPISLVVMYGATFLFGSALVKIHNKRGK